MAHETFTEHMKEKYENREDKDNLYGVGISDAEFRRFAIQYLLGEDWYVVDPIGPTQVNEIALMRILERYSKEYRKEAKNAQSVRKTSRLSADCPMFCPHKRS